MDVHGIYEQLGERPLFLDAPPVMAGIVNCDFLTEKKRNKDWWIGKVIHCGGGALDRQVQILFQIADVDLG